MIFFYVYDEKFQVWIVTLLHSKTSLIKSYLTKSRILYNDSKTDKFHRKGCNDRVKYWHVKYKKRVLPRSIRHTSNSESALTFRPGCVLLSRTLKHTRNFFSPRAASVCIQIIYLFFFACFFALSLHKHINIALQQISRCVRLGSVWLHPGAEKVLVLFGRND